MHDFIPQPLFPDGSDVKPEKITYEEWREIEDAPAVKKIFGEPPDPMSHDCGLDDINYGVKFHITWWDSPNKCSRESDLFVFFDDPTAYRPTILLRDTKTGQFAVLQELRQLRADETKTTKIPNLHWQSAHNYHRERT